MKKIKWFFMFTLLFILLMTSCKKTTFTITFDTMGGSYIANIEVVKGQKLSKPANPTKDGYEFAGWYEVPSLSDDNLYDFNKVVNYNFTLYAKWIQKSYHINYELDGGSFSSEVNNTFQEASKYLLPTPTKEGHTFLGWYENQNGQEIKVTKLENRDYNLTAKWEARTFQVRFVTNNDETIDPVEIKYGKLLEEPKKLTKENYDFVGWSFYGTMYDFSKPVNQNMTLEAVWEMQKEALDNYLQSLVPQNATENLNLVENIDGSSASFIWTSSNEDVITNEGILTRFTTDQNIVLKVNVVYPDHSYELTFNVRVPKITLKPLTNGKIVSAYLYDSGNVNITDQALAKLNIINYSFAEISNGEIYFAANQNPEKVVAYRQKGVRVILAIGGWGAGGFSNAMLTQEGRTKLVNSLMDAIKKYQFDGIDIDWEYPTSGAGGIDHNANDRTNLTLFCQELKTKMLEYRKDLILTIAAVPTPSFFDFTGLDPYVDYYNLMTYDFALSKTAYHDSALYRNQYATSSLDSSVTSLINCGVASTKIIPGVAFYGRKAEFTSSATLGSSLKTDLVAGSISYKQLKGLLQEHPDMVESYDDVAKASYIIYNNTFYTYDSPRSILDKCNYVKDHNLAGLMAWELASDFVDENQNFVLVDAMANGLV